MGKISAGTKGERAKAQKKKYLKTAKGKQVYKKYQRKYALSEKGKRCHKKAEMKFRYGISVEEYNQMFEEQKGGCAICGKHQSENQNGNALSVDHNHITKQVRGLLCGTCNRAIGELKVDESGVKLFLKAIDYINRAKEVTDGQA